MQVSCVEIDFLVDKASSFPGVFGSRLTGKFAKTFPKKLFVSRYRAKSVVEPF